MRIKKINVTAIALIVVFLLVFSGCNNVSEPVHEEIIPDTNADVIEPEPEPEPEPETEEFLFNVIKNFEYPPELSGEEQISMNKILMDKLQFPLRRMIECDFQYGPPYFETLEYNKNLLDSDIRKLHYVIELMLADPALADSFDYESRGVSGEFQIKYNIINDYYKKFWNEEINKTILKDLYYGIDGEYFYGTHVTGWGLSSFIIKAKSLEYDSQTDIYTLTCAFLTSIIEKQDGGYIECDYSELYEVSDPSVLVWDPALNYAKFELKYKEEKSGDWKLLSLILYDE